MSLAKPVSGEGIQIAGYGVDSADATGTRHLAQKSRNGSLTSVSSVLRYRVDTTRGNSGSAIVSLITQSVIGIHTNGDAESTRVQTVAPPSIQTIDCVERLKDAWTDMMTDQKF